MNTNEVVSVRTGSRGKVPEGAEELAITSIRSVLRHVVKPVLSARVTLTVSADPAVAFPAAAHATIDVNGRIVRARGAGQTMREAIGRMTDRLRVQLDRTVHARQSLASHARRSRFLAISRLPADVT
jgi:ribosome-associated translation inhibitor RaiA